MELAKKLQLGEGQRIRGVDVPDALTAALDWEATPVAHDEAALLVFVMGSASLVAKRPAIVGAASKDRLTWVAYPKGGQLGTDLNRDSLAASLSAHGIRPVRQVSLDELWSALRFRPA